MADLGNVLSAATQYGNDREAEGAAEERDRHALEVAELNARLISAEAETAELQAEFAAHMATHEPDPDPDPEPTDFGRRVYVTQQVSTVNELNSYTSQFANAHATTGANGLSIRFPWKSYDADKTVATRGDAIKGALTHYSLRSMAGKHTPTAKMGRTITEDGTTYPSPFGDTAGNPNTVFLDHLETHYRELAELLDDSDEVDPILQWTWYAKEWAEIYHGPAVRSAPGYTVQKFINAHKALIDRAAAVQADYPGVVMGLQLSGHGPIANVQVPDGSGGTKTVVLVEELVKHAATVFEAGRAIIHANGWSYRGQWGQQDSAIDETMDAAFLAAISGNLHVGMQAIQPWGVSGTYPQYTASQATQAYGQADLAGATSIEFYTPSLLSGNGGQVWAAPTANWINEEN